MRKPRDILRAMRVAWSRWLTPRRETRELPSIDPREFSELLRSGRKQDLQSLAQRLSEHAGPLSARRPGRSSGQEASNPKGRGVPK